MPQTKYELYQEASLSQKLAHKHRELSSYVGFDAEISLKLAKIEILCQFKFLDRNAPDIKFMKALLDEKRKALFATSPELNEVSKLGLWMPKKENVWGKDEEEEEDASEPVNNDAP